MVVTNVQLFNQLLKQNYLNSYIALCYVRSYVAVRTNRFMASFQMMVVLVGTCFGEAIFFLINVGKYGIEIYYISVDKYEIYHFDTLDQREKTVYKSHIPHLSV